jgi:hypothetical protein
LWKEATSPKPYPLDAFELASSQTRLPRMAEICTECAKDGERIGDMDDFVQACKSCAASCRAMAS